MDEVIFGAMNVQLVFILVIVGFVAGIIQLASRSRKQTEKLARMEEKLDKLIPDKEK